MATRLQTVQYCFPALTTLANNTLTNLTLITIDLPNINATPVFRSVIARVSMDDIVTATGGTVTTKTFGLRLAAAAYTSVSNANALTHSGENLSLFWDIDFTAHFNTNWTGTSDTCDFRLQINQSTGTTLGQNNVCVTLEITYEFDDAAATQIKTAMIPLNADLGAMTIGGPPVDTFPALDTYCPEAGKTYRALFVVVQGNTNNGTGGSLDTTITVLVGASNETTQIHEGSQVTDRWFRYVYDLQADGYAGHGATQDFYLWSSNAGRYHHVQAYAVVTYEYTIASTTRLLISQMLPMEITSPMGGTAASDSQRASREMWIPEPGTINNTKLAFYLFWSQIGAMAGLNARLGTGAYAAYTDQAAVLGGGNGCMIRNDSAFTLARGRNSLQMDVYRTDTADLGWGVGGFWLANYHCDVPTGGVGAASRTISHLLFPMGTAAAAAIRTETPTNTPDIPETNYFISALGMQFGFLSNSTATPTSMNLLVERLAAEGGQQWDSLYVDGLHLDAEVGMNYQWAQVRNLFQRWAGDPDTSRMDIETSRRYRQVNGQAAAGGFSSLNAVMVYHDVEFTVSGSITGFSGTVTLNLHRVSTGEIVLTTTRSGDGAYSFTWYDNTENMFVSASDGTTHGRSANGLGGATLDITVTGGGGTTVFMPSQTVGGIGAY